MKKIDKLKNLNDAINFEKNNTYMSIFLQNVKNNKDPEDVLNGLVAINSYLLILDNLSTEEDIDKEFEDIYEFAKWFEKNYMSNPRINDVIKNEYEERAPKLYILYLNYIEDLKQKEMEKLFNKLNEKSKKNVDILSNYINDCKTYKQVIFLCDGDSDTDCGMFQVKEDEVQLYQNVVNECCIKTMVQGGTLIFRYFKDNKIIVNGFVIKDQHIYNLEEKVLKHFFKINEEIMEEYQINDFATAKEVYEIAKCKFQ